MLSSVDNRSWLDDISSKSMLSNLGVYNTPYTAGWLVDDTSVLSFVDSKFMIEKMLGSVV